MQVNEREKLWVEKYRPSTIDDCVLSKNIKEQLKNIVDKNDLPNLLLVGSPGTGKTTTAKAICEQLGYDYILVNCSEDSGIETLRQRIRQFASSMSLNSTTKVVILDEVDYANCLPGDNFIKLSNGEQVTLESVANSTVSNMSYNSELSQYEMDTAHITEIQKEQEIFSIEMENGSTIECMINDSFLVWNELTQSEEWRSIFTGFENCSIIQNK